MNEITLPSAQIIQNSSPGGPSTSTVPLDQGGSPQYRIFRRERGRNIVSLKPECHIVSLVPECQSEGRNPRSPTLQAGSINHCNRPLTIF